MVFTVYRMSLLILYGSETGTAQDTAETLRREAILQGLTVKLMGMDEYVIDELCNEQMALFVVSTTGQGEFPPNMRGAWRRLLRKALPPTWLAETHIAVFALGDSSYQKYNFAGKKLYRRLLQLGGQQLIELGLGDDQHELGLDGAFQPWKQELWKSIAAKSIFPNMKTEFDLSTPLPPKFNLIPSDKSNGEKRTQVTDEWHQLNVLRNQRVTAENHFQDTRLVDLAIPAEFRESFQYAPGDVLMVWPFNSSSTVDIAIEAMAISDEVLDRTFRIEPSDPFIKPPPTWLIGEITSLRICLQRLFDLQMVPRKSFFEVMGSISSDEMEKEKLMELASPAGIDDLIDYSIRSRRTVAETLQDFPHTAKNIQPERFFDLFCYIRPRAFSIASCMEAQHDVIQIIAAKVQYKSRMREPRRGLCSSYLASLLSGDKVFAKIRSGTFKFPPPSVPVVCIGPGTGIAPFRSYLTSRESTSEAADSLLFFGCRGRDRDFYFNEEWPNLTKTRVVTAFSRDQDNKVYVQDKLRENAEEVWKILNDQNGSAFVAGSAGDMPKAVALAIDEIASSKGYQGSFTAMLEAKSRLQYETWS